MFQPKARRAVSVLALTGSLFFLPLASASAATSQEEPVLSDLLVQIEAQIVTIWDALRGSTTDVGPRMDDNG